MQTTTKHKLGTDDGARADFPRLGNRYVLRAEETAGRFALVEHTLPPRSLAAPIHVHEHEDEFSFVIAGRMGAQIGDETVEAGPGELVLKPRGIPHAFWNAGDEEARVLEIISPGGFAQYFAEMAPVLTAEDGPDLEALGAIQARYGLTMDRDRIGPLMEQHGLEP
ncbi:MAG: cupin domain-containing protein [Actinobacteria bacterium]|nr:cupin domain-containing protein [Actinomycetota bacterium]